MLKQFKKDRQMLATQEFNFQGLKDAFYKAWESGDVGACGEIIDREMPSSLWANPVYAESIETMMLLLSSKRPVGESEKAFYQSLEIRN